MVGVLALSPRSPNSGTAVNRAMTGDPEPGQAHTRAERQGAATGTMAERRSAAEPMAGGL